MEQVIANQSSVLSSAGITLNWDQLYNDLSITDTYPTIKFVVCISSIISVALLLYMPLWISNCFQVPRPSLYEK